MFLLALTCASLAWHKQLWLLLRLIIDNRTRRVFRFLNLLYNNEDVSSDSICSHHVPIKVKESHILQLDKQTFIFLLANGDQTLKFIRVLNLFQILLQTLLILRLRDWFLDL